ncbi:hypothetical protein V1514DRAFT_83437 [Lipomyces japonicus]|uniref:uncharacterized protein n=1 Tax=Lipomyces japonicus TaxID=56871 RepID=UPI0034CFE0B4
MTPRKVRVKPTEACDGFADVQKHYNLRSSKRLKRKLIGELSYSTKRQKIEGSLYNETFTASESDALGSENAFAAALFFNREDCSTLASHKKRDLKLGSIALASQISVANDLYLPNGLGSSRSAKVADKSEIEVLSSTIQTFTEVGKLETGSNEHALANPIELSEEITRLFRRPLFTIKHNLTRNSRTAVSSLKRFAEDELEPAKDKKVLRLAVGSNAKRDQVAVASCDLKRFGQQLNTSISTVPEVSSSIKNQTIKHALRPQIPDPDLTGPEVASGCEKNGFEEHGVETAATFSGGIDEVKKLLRKAKVPIMTPEVSLQSPEFVHQWFDIQWDTMRLPNNWQVNHLFGGQSIGSLRMQGYCTPDVTVESEELRKAELFGNHCEAYIQGLISSSNGTSAKDETLNEAELYAKCKSMGMTDEKMLRTQKQLEFMAMERLAHMNLPEEYSVRLNYLMQFLPDGDETTAKLELVPRPDTGYIRHLFVRLMLNYYRGVAQQEFIKAGGLCVCLDNEPYRIFRFRQRAESELYFHSWLSRHRVAYGIGDEPLTLDAQLRLAMIISWPWIFLLGIFVICNFLHKFCISYLTA